MSETFREGEFMLNSLFRLLTTTISIFDSSIGLLAGPVRDGAEMPGPAAIQCIKATLEFLGVGNEDDRALRAELCRYVMVPLSPS